MRSLRHRDAAKPRSRTLFLTAAETLVVSAEAQMLSSSSSTVSLSQPDH